MRFFLLSFVAAAVVVVAQEQPHAASLQGRQLNDDYTVLYGKKFWGKRHGGRGGGEDKRV
ncbi:unnamed protein product [Aphanomyces euteiches]